MLYSWFGSCNVSSNDLPVLYSLFLLMLESRFPELIVLKRLSCVFFVFVLVVSMTRESTVLNGLSLSSNLKAEI